MIYTQQKITLEEISKIPLIKPIKAGMHWKGIQHGDLAKYILKEWNSRGYSCKINTIVLNETKENIGLVFDVAYPGIIQLKEWNYQLGVVNSNSRKFRMRWFSGGFHKELNRHFINKELFLQDNGLKHAPNMELESVVKGIMKEHIGAVYTFGEDVEDLQERELTAREMEKVLIYNTRHNNTCKGAMIWSRIGKVFKLWDLSKETIGDMGRNTSWRLMMCFAEVVKMNPPIRQMVDLNNFRKCLPTNDQLRLRLD